MSMHARDIARFRSCYTEGPDCWQWQRPLDNGYGRFWLNGQTLLAHRVAWFLAHGQYPPAGLQVDHLCRNRACVRHDHLEPVTIAENVLRGEGRSARNARKTHCHKGHALSGANLYLTNQGTRQCRTCSVEHTRLWRAKQAAG